MATLHKFESALCAQIDPELFFPPRGGSNIVAKGICAKCPERVPCAKEGLEGEKYGIWGQLSAEERYNDPRWKPKPELERFERHLFDQLILRLKGLGWDSYQIADEIHTTAHYVQTRFATLRRTTHEEEAA